MRGEPVHHLPDRVMPLLLIPVLGGEPDPGALPLVVDVAGRHQEAVLDHVDRLTLLQRDRERLPRVVGAERDVTRPRCLHHDQRHAGQDPVPAAAHLHRLQPDLGVGVQQHVVAEVHRVLAVQLHLGDRHLNVPLIWQVDRLNLILAMSLIGGCLAHPDLADLQPDIDRARRSSSTSWPPPSLIHAGSTGTCR